MQPNIKFKPVVAILVVTIVGLLLLLTYIFIPNDLFSYRKNNNVLENNSTNDTSVNDNYREAILILKTPTLGLESNNVISLELQSELPEDSNLIKDNGSARISFTGGEFFIFSGLGETGGLKNNVSLGRTILNSNLNKLIYKVSTAKEHLYQAGEFAQSRTRFFFYTDSFKTGQECRVLDTQYDGCGYQEITISKDSRNYNLGIYCAVENDSYSIICDKFVENLKVSFVD